MALCVVEWGHVANRMWGEFSGGTWTVLWNSRAFLLLSYYEKVVLFLHFLKVAKGTLANTTNYCICDRFSCKCNLSFDSK